MRIYERYFARQIYLAFGLALFALVGILFFFDLIRQLNSIGQGNYRFGYALIYVALLIPLRGYEMMPAAALIGAIYVFAAMAANSEYASLRVSGLSAWRALYSLMKAGSLLAAVTFLTGEIIVPYAGQLSQHIRLNAIGSAVWSSFQSGVWVKDTLDDDDLSRPVARFVNVGELMPDATIRHVRIYEFDAQFQLTKILVAQRGKFAAPNHWQLTGVTATHLLKLAPSNASRHAHHQYDGDPLQPLYRAIQTTMPTYLMRSQLTPEILAVLLVPPQRMSIVSLFSYLRYLQQNHQDTRRYRLALWQKASYPCTLLVMLALSLPFAYLRARAGAVGVKVFSGVMLGMSFQLTNALFSHLGLLKGWPAPLVAAAPSLIYLAFGIIALHWADRH